MTPSEFSELVKHHFRYLVDDYSFSMTREDYSTQAMGNAEVVFQSPSTGISIVLDRGQVLIQIGRASEHQREWFEFSDVVQFFAPDVDPVYIFPSDFSDHRSAIESQIRRLALVLRQNCERLLVGDFSMEDAIKRLEEGRVANLVSELEKLRPESSSDSGTGP